MPPTGFEPTISAVELLQTQAFERAVTGIDNRPVKVPGFIAWTKTYIIWAFLQNLAPEFNITYINEAHFKVS